MTDEAEPGTTISIKRTIDAPAEELFAAWTDPALLEQWQADKVEFEAFEGGAFRFETEGDEDMPGVHVVVGEVLGFELNTRLVEKWHFQGEDADAVEASTLTVNFRELPDGRTELTLTEDSADHANAESRIFSIEAWNQALEELAELLE